LTLRSTWHRRHRTILTHNWAAQACSQRHHPRVGFEVSAVPLLVSRPVAPKLTPSSLCSPPRPFAAHRPRFSVRARKWQDRGEEWEPGRLCSSYVGAAAVPRGGMLALVAWFHLLSPLATHSCASRSALAAARVVGQEGDGGGPAAALAVSSPSASEPAHCAFSGRPRDAQHPASTPQPESGLHTLPGLPTHATKRKADVTFTASCCAAGPVAVVGPPRAHGQPFQGPCCARSTRGTSQHNWSQARSAGVVRQTEIV
jgi:hypothetical protein